MVGHRVIPCAFAILVLAAFARACSNDCTGGVGESCLTCSQACGLCDAAGVVTHCTAPGTVHMSFDDGPNQFSPQVLDLLKARNIKASFWLIGQNIAGNEASVQRMNTEGHHIGDHTWTHPSLNTLTQAQVLDELSRTKTAIESVVPGLTLTTMRPPSGDLNNVARNAALSLGLTPVMWNFDNQDWRGTDSWVVGNTTAMLAGHSIGQSSFIMLSHPNNLLAFSRLSWVLDQVTLAGYKFVSYDDCINPNEQPGPNATPAGVTTPLAECAHKPWPEAFDVLCGAGVMCGQPVDGSIHCCSRSGYCGVGPDFCGAGCQGGACQTCINAGYIPYLKASTASTGAGGSGSGTSGATGGGSSTTTPVPSAASSIPLLPSLLLLPAALGGLLILRKGARLFK